MSRGLIKNLLLEVIERNEGKVRAALERAATNPKCILQVLDLAAKLNKEVGHPPDGRGAETHFHIHTNVSVMALKAAAHRAVQPAPAALPEPAESGEGTPERTRRRRVRNLIYT